MVTRAKKPPTTPNSPVAGKPGGAASRFLRVDFPTNIEGTTQFNDFIETKTPRIAWSRAVQCQCVGYAAATDQVDPECLVCSGKGWRYFRPRDYVVDTATLGPLDPIQAEIVRAQNAVVIRGFIAGVSSTPDIYQALGPWANGTGMVTLRPENRMGYYDRLVQLEDEAVYAQRIVHDGARILKTRYPVVGVNFLGSFATEYFPETDFTLTDLGEVQWKVGKAPAAGTMVSVHYLHHPTWVVWEFANLIRTSLVQQRVARPATPDGSILRLPQRAMIRLEYLPTGPRAGADE